MKMQQFKTNVKCGACVAAITPEMEKINKVTWEVDLSHPDRILTVNGEVASETIIEAIGKSGYKAESF